MNIALEELQQSILRLSDTATERSYYPPLCNFFTAVGEMHGRKGITANAEEGASGGDTAVGFPDITVHAGEKTVGWIEVKLPKDALSSEKFERQFKKYRDSLENILFTNLREWELWQWKDDKPTQVAKLTFDVLSYQKGSEDKLDTLLLTFLEGFVYQARTPRQLALALARKTRLLSQHVEETLEEVDEDAELTKLKRTFEKTLIQDIDAHQFSNMVAETIAYSFFLAALEHDHRGSTDKLDINTAVDYLPTNVPVLADLYGLVTKIAKQFPSIKHSSELLIEQINASDIHRIYQKLTQHKPGEDPVLTFYEPFLAEYDPKEREARGVYYTPKPVVDYIVRGVDWLLRNKFCKSKGLADESVHLLDPATGSGTFIMSAIQEIHDNIKKENTALGEEMINLEFNKVVVNHILKHFYGFELLIAPYAIAHLKLTMKIEELGFNFLNTKFDDDKDNDRFKVYLANTLDDPNKPSQRLFGFDSIPQESEMAREVKKNVPILAIVGNPPYSNFGRMNRGEWIMNLLNDYKRGLKERKINLDDDFIKFIRFAQWKLSEAGQGIFAMITSNTFIDGITHRQMRRSLMDAFDEIYIYNLHGNSRKGEITPDGGKDENVFDIQQGVSINVFIKYPKKQKETFVKYCDLWGLREKKFSTLYNQNFDNTQWKLLSPNTPNWFFVDKDTSKGEEYNKYSSLADIFIDSGPGIKTERDDLVVHFSHQEINEVIDDFKKEPTGVLESKYDTRDTRDWTLARAKSDIKDNVGKFIKLNYRPFDFRQSYFTGQSRGFMGTPGKTARAFNFPNIALITKRQTNNLIWNYSFVTNIFPEVAIMFSTPGNPLIFPLYRYPETQQGSLLGQEDHKSNISVESINKFSEKLQLKFINTGLGDLNTTLGPEAIFYYSYAVFHSQFYRTRYAEQLKIDFPRLPITVNKKLFTLLVRLGNELVNYHLLGENPFDKSKTIFDETSKWNVKPITQNKPAIDWNVTEVKYDKEQKRVYVNPGQYFEGVEKEVWEFMIGGYQVCEKWLKDRKKAERVLSVDDIKHYMKIVVSLRETIRVMKEIDKVIGGHGGWPIK